MKITPFVTETGRVGIEATAEEFGTKKLLRRRVKLAERKPFIDALNGLEKRLNEANERQDEDAALEISKEMITKMVEGISMDDFELLDMYDVQDLANAVRELMENGGRAAKKNE